MSALKSHANFVALVENLCEFPKDLPTFYSSHALAVIQLDILTRMS